MKTRTLKPLQNYTGDCFYDLGIGNVFLDRTQKHQSLKNNKLAFVNISIKMGKGLKRTWIDTSPKMIYRWPLNTQKTHTSLITRGITVKTTLRYYSHAVGWPLCIHLGQVFRWGCGKIGTLVAVGGNVKWHCRCGNDMALLKKVSMEFRFWVNTWKNQSTDLNRHVDTNVHGSSIHSSPTWRQATRPPVDEWVSKTCACLKRNVIQPEIGGSANVCYSTGEPWWLWSRSQRDKYYMIPFMWGTWSSQIHRDEFEWWCQQLQGGKNGKLWCNGCRV